MYPTKVREDVRALCASKAKVQPRTSGGAPGAGCAIRHVLAAVSKRALAECTQQLSILQDAGLPLVRSLRILGEQQRAGTPEAGAGEGVERCGGRRATLSEAMERHPKAFDRLYVNMVRAGETGGVLDVVILQRLSEFMEKSQRLKRRIIGAMVIHYVRGDCVFGADRHGDHDVCGAEVPGYFPGFSYATLPAITEWLIGTSDWIAISGNTGG